MQTSALGHCLLLFYWIILILNTVCIVSMVDLELSLLVIWNICWVKSYFSWKTRSKNKNVVLVSLCKNIIEVTQWVSRTFLEQVQCFPAVTVADYQYTVMLAKATWEVNTTKQGSGSHKRGQVPLAKHRTTARERRWLVSWPEKISRIFIGIYFDNHLNVSIFSTENITFPAQMSVKSEVWGNTRDRPNYRPGRLSDPTFSIFPIIDRIGDWFSRAEGVNNHSHGVVNSNGL